MVKKTKKRTENIAYYFAALKTTQVFKAIEQNE